MNLGFRELVRIDNMKYVFLDSDYEIVLEEVKGLGLFLEVEKMHVDDDVLKVKENIQKLHFLLDTALGEEAY